MKAIGKDLYSFSLCEILELTDYINTDDILQKSWHLINDIKEIPKCSICNKDRKFYTITEGYSSTCGNKKCQNMHTKLQREKSMMKKYGFKSPMQNIDVFKRTMKNAYKLKDYILPSGKVVKVQGYEPLILDELFSKGYEESDIIISDKDIEKYIGSMIYNTNDGKSHRYYPDIYIVSENMVIEVKSKYTYDYDKEINLLKMQSVLNKSINFKFRIL